MTRLLAALALVSASSVAAQTDNTAPLSAIDWLSRSVEVPVAAPAQPSLPPRPQEPPVAETGAVPEIIVTPLDSPGAGAIGLLEPEVTGLPLNLWSASSTPDLTDLIARARPDTLPAVQDLFVTLLLARAAAPLDGSGDNRLLLARADKLLDMGALEPARVLLEQTGVADPQVYRRWFDVSLLTGTEDRACEELRNRPALAPTYPARIFCLARNGDWTGAALTLNTARALGDVTDEEDALLSRFLDPAIAEAAADMDPPSRLSPLVFLIRDAIGEGLPTAGLPLAFAHADLRPTVAWRNQMEAAERLARNGAITGDALLAVYMLRTPAASGGVWDRAEAVQRFAIALRARDPGAVAAALGPAWQAMKTVRAEVPFAELYAADLAALPLTGEPGRIAVTLGLLSRDYEAVALDWTPQTERERLLAAVARGDVSGLPSPPSAPNEAAIHAAFDAAPVPDAIADHIAAGRLGEALLRALTLLTDGASGDQQALTDGLAALRSVGMEDAARRIALQVLILERPS